MRSKIRVEVVYAAEDRQLLTAVDVDAGSTVEQALRRSGIYDRFPNDPLRECDVGIWGQCVSRSSSVKDGDRIELYRPLRMDPREARRLRAKF